MSLSHTAVGPNIAAVDTDSRESVRDQTTGITILTQVSSPGISLCITYEETDLKHNSNPCSKRKKSFV